MSEFLTKLSRASHLCEVDLVAVIFSPFSLLNKSTQHNLSLCVDSVMMKSWRQFQRSAYRNQWRLFFCLDSPVARGSDVSVSSTSAFQNSAYFIRPVCVFDLWFLIYKLLPNLNNAFSATRLKHTLIGGRLLLLYNTWTKIKCTGKNQACSFILIF